MSFLSTYFYGVLNLGLWQYVGLSVACFYISMMSITLYLHRDQAHRAIDLHPWLRHFFRMWLWINAGALTEEWVAVHRKHHAMCEREGDPHSPQIFGIRKVLLEGAELYKTEAAKSDVIEKYSRGTPRDWMQRNVYSRFHDGGVWILVLGSLLLLGAPGIIFLGIQLISMPVFAAGIINGAGHYWGYRNFEGDDASTNLTPFAVLIGGEELHNNHHAFPTSAKFSVRRWEFDIGWLYICIFRALGLCTVRRLAPKPYIEDSRQVDLQTLRAVLINRMHVMRDYTRSVTLPELRRERLADRGNKMLRRAKLWLIKRPHMLDEFTRQNLLRILENNHTLRTVHDLRESLVEIWEQANVSNECLVKDLKDWCAEAEASGIRSLEEFSARLRGYIPQPVLVS